MTLLSLCGTSGQQKLPLPTAFLHPPSPLQSLQSQGNLSQKRRERRLVILFIRIHTGVHRSSCKSSRKRRPVQTGSIYPRLQRPIFLAYIVKSKHFVFATRWIQNGFIERTKVKERESRGYQNILLFVFSLLSFRDTLILYVDAQIGTIIPSTTPFGTANADNLPRTSRKRTFVEELVDDAETKHLAKKKFLELQKVRGARGKKTLAQKESLRQRKW
jgi:hypothetical protein